MLSRIGGWLFIPLPDELVLQKPYDRLLKKAEHQTVHIRDLGGAFRYKGFDQRMNLLVITEHLVQQHIILGDFHIEYNRYMGA